MASRPSADARDSLPPVTSDVLIVGGGLAGSLAAWRLATARPDLTVHLLERDGALGGNHTWSFHDDDIAAAARTWLAPLVAARWPAYTVQFPGLRRRIEGGYQTISSERLHAVVSGALGARVELGAQVIALDRGTVTLASGAVRQARVVIDARGDVPTKLPLGWQVFVGQEFECEAPHALDVPILMDATVPQVDAYRFIYVLPLGTRRLLVEDTSYADQPDVHADPSRRAIARYMAGRGWRARHLIREERGALPLPLAGSAEAFWPDDRPRIGLRAGLFHPTTGYSLPDAVATADLLVGLDLVDGVDTGRALRAFATARWRQRAFFRLLNRLLFRAARPDARTRVLEQFHRRPADLIRRFYGARLTRLDQCRLLTGRPPVPLRQALAHLRESSVM